MRPLLQNICYLPYGYHRPPENAGVITAFNAQLLDIASGMYILGSGRRCYSPALVRFVSPDHLSPFAEGGLNTYAYCAGDPINYCDPSGNIKVRPLTQLNHIRLRLPPANRAQARGELRRSNRVAREARTDAVTLLAEAQRMEGEASRQMDPVQQQIGFAHADHLRGEADISAQAYIELQAEARSFAGMVDTRRAQQENLIPELKSAPALTNPSRLAEDAPGQQVAGNPFSTEDSSARVRGIQRRD